MGDVTHDDVTEAIFGSFDGLTSSLGVIAGVVAAGVATGGRVFAAALGLSIAATIGMGVGQWLSDPNHSIRLGVVMAVATLLGSALPALPFLFGLSVTTCVASGVIVLIGALIIGKFRGYRVTFTVLIVVAVLTIGLSILVA